MGKERKSDATSLGEILEAASRQQLSGLLRIEQTILRTQVTSVEEGEVYLLAGQPISAQTGKLTGQEALQYLLTWHRIRFSLTIDAPRPVANVFAHFRVRPALSPLPPLSLEQMVPRRKRVEQDALSLPLTRPQRLLYFLINGERTMADLARCSGKTLREVESVVRELQTQGLIIV
jgi:hypothetical protein